MAEKIGAGNWRLGASGLMQWAQMQVERQ